MVQVIDRLTTVMGVLPLSASFRQPVGVRCDLIRYTMQAMKHWKQSVLIRVTKCGQIAT